MKKIRTKEIKIRVSDDEYQKLIELKTKIRLAEWIRETVLQVKPVKQKPMITLDPSLAKNFSSIGSNINQIARVVNTQKANVDNVLIISSLAMIERQLNAIREILINDSEDV